MTEGIAAMEKELSEMTLDELWEFFPIFLVEHNDKWNYFYDEIETKLQRILSACNVERISHIGSTAIPEIWAKNIVDVLIEISSDSDIENVAQIIENNGFSFAVGWKRDVLRADSGEIVLNGIKLTKDNFSKYVLEVGTVLEDIDNQFICNKVKEEFSFPDK